MKNYRKIQEIKVANLLSAHLCRSIVLFVLFFSFFVSSNAQTQFDNGFKAGFKEGYCYNSKVGCIMPITPLTPLTRIGESLNNYTHGYNRGFQVGLDLSRINTTGELGYLPNSFSYPIGETFKSSDYVPPVNLGLLATVLAKKQALYDSRSEWIQNSFYRISDLSYSILKERGAKYHQAMMTAVEQYADILSKNNYDLTDDNIFVQIQEAFKLYDKRLYQFFQLIQKEKN
jgi:hypothetical protein